MDQRLVLFNFPITNKISCQPIFYFAIRVNAAIQTTKLKAGFRLMLITSTAKYCFFVNALFALYLWSKRLLTRLARSLADYPAFIGCIGNPGWSLA